MAVIFLTTDLMFSSRLAGVARAQGVQLSVANSAAAAIEKISENNGRRLIIDLNTAGLSIADFVARCREANESVDIIAYGPHVHEAKLAAAREAGCDVVLTRGQFNSQMTEILTSG